MFPEQNDNSPSNMRASFLVDKTARLIVQLHTCLLVGEVSSCHQRTRVPIGWDEMHSWSARRHVFLFNQKTCLLAQQADASGCS
jgi:hypothetical protein